jgi:nicotinamidase-related amidase
MEIDFFLHPGLSPHATAGRGVVNATVNMIEGFRKAGMKILWTNVWPGLVATVRFTEKCSGGLTTLISSRCLLRS